MHLSISCSDCVMEGTAACEDCVVTFLCSREPGEAPSGGPAAAGAEVA